MIQLTYKIAILLFLFTSGVGLQAKTTSEKPITQEQVWKTEFKKNINEEFNISADGDVSLTNKYGKVDLKTWSQNKVKIDVTITVDARNQSDANDIFERIKIQFDNGADFVKAETSIPSLRQQLQRSESWSAARK